MEMKSFPESVQSSDKGSWNDGSFISSEPTLATLSRQLLSGDSTLTCTPWRTKDYSCDTAGLHEEINDFFDYMKPRPSEIRMRREVIQRVMNIILFRHPYARIETFGSFVTRLFLPSSDIDLVVYQDLTYQPQPLVTLEEDFKAHDIVMEGTAKVLNNLTVPVIKFCDKLTGVKVDISFNQDTGHASAELIFQFFQVYPFLPKLVILLKQFLAHRRLYEVFVGGISSYGLFLLVVSFLQQHPQQGKADLSADLGKLLIEFFELYGRKFNYMKTGICVLNGGSYIAKDEYDIQDFLFIRDPVLPPSLPLSEANAARGCYGMWQVKQAFEAAYSRLSSAVLTRETPLPRRESLLGAVVKVPKIVDDYRNLTDNHWPTHPLSPPTAVTPVCYPAPNVPWPGHFVLHPLHSLYQFSQQDYPQPPMSSELDSSGYLPATSSPSHSSDRPSASTAISNDKS